MGEMAMAEDRKRRDREQARRRAITMYWADIDRRKSHDEAWYHVMHEVRALSEDDLWVWLKESEGYANRRLPAEFPEVKPSEELVVDDADTALAPEDGKWAFDDSVTAAFDDMLQRSIPNYRDMREFVTRAALWHAHQLQVSPSQPVHIMDLGASRGSGLAPIVDSLGARARYTAYELSDPMIEVLQERFEGMIQARVLDVVQRDLRNGVTVAVPAVAALSVLTLQFIPIEYRQRLLRDVHQALAPGGALILVEKVLGATAELDSMEVDLYYDVKRGAGYTQEAIDRKRLSLEGVLVPLTARMNEDLLRDAGFAAVDCCWAWSNFRGWVAVKR